MHKGRLTTDNASNLEQIKSMLRSTKEHKKPSYR